MKTKLKLSNIIDNMDEFIRRAGNTMPDEITDILIKIQKNNKIPFNLGYRLIEYFDEIVIYLDYDEFEIIQIRNLINENNKYLKTQLTHIWSNQSWGNIPMFKKFNDPNLGFSLSDINKSKREYCSLLNNKMLYHSTDVNFIDYIKTHGLTTDFNFFNIEYRECFGNAKTYGLIGINSKKVLNRIYPDPEGFLNFDLKADIELDTTLFGNIAYWEYGNLNLDVLNYLYMNFSYYKEIGISDWQCVKGKISPELIDSVEILSNNKYRDNKH